MQILIASIITYFLFVSIQSYVPVINIQRHTAHTINQTFILTHTYAVIQVGKCKKGQISPGYFK
jgi:hypothetical protein